LAYPIWGNPALQIVKIINIFRDKKKRLEETSYEAAKKVSNKELTDLLSRFSKYFSPLFLTSSSGLPWWKKLCE
jgi:hypothetical protein